MLKLDLKYLCANAAVMGAVCVICVWLRVCSNEGTKRCQVVHLGHLAAL